MTTGSDIVQSALEQQGVLSDNATPSANQLARGLRALNRMLQSWANERAMIYSLSLENFPLTAGTPNYPTSLLASGRPVDVTYMYLSLSGVSYPVSLVDTETFDDIGYPSTTAVPTMCNYDQAYPIGTFKFYPVPYGAFTCYVECQRVLSAPITAVTVLSMPEGYEKAIIDNLAVYENYGIPPTRQMILDAMESRNVLKRKNYEPLLMETMVDDNYSVCNDFPYSGF